MTPASPSQPEQVWITALLHSKELEKSPVPSAAQARALIQVQVLGRAPKPALTTGAHTRVVFPAQELEQPHMSSLIPELEQAGATAIFQILNNHPHHLQTESEQAQSRVLIQAHALEQAPRQPHFQSQRRLKPGIHF